MTVNTTISVVGVKETINALKKIDPQLQKDFRAQANEIAQPAINAAKDM
jgi:flagellar biogenesis protein FliO